jgi:MOSC domain-containing protein YiiM
MGSRIVSVNVGRARDEEWAGRMRRTAIDKRPVTDPVAVGELGLVGDEIADLVNHGGPYKAVYAFAQEDLDYWSEQLGERVPPGFFGENLTTEGIDVSEALLGERWRIGSVLVEVVAIRIPCWVFKNWLGVNGYDDTGWAKRVTAQARPGAYLRVLEPGILQVGDELQVEHRPDHDVSITTLFRAATTDRELLARVAAMPGLDRIDPVAQRQARAYVVRAE